MTREVIRAHTVRLTRGRLFFILRSLTGSPRAGVKGSVKTGQRPLDKWLWTERAVLSWYRRNKHSVWNQKFWVDGGRQRNGRKAGEKF